MQEFLYLRRGERRIRLNLEDIKFVTLQRSLTVLCLENSKPLTTKVPLYKWAQLLSDKGFLKIHEKFIVAISKIDSFDRYNVYVGENEIPIGQGCFKELTQNLTIIARPYVVDAVLRAEYLDR